MDPKCSRDREGTGEPLGQAHLPSQTSALRGREADVFLVWSSFRSANSVSCGQELPGREDAHSCAATFPQPSTFHHGSRADRFPNPIP